MKTFPTHSQSMGPGALPGCSIGRKQGRMRASRRSASGDRNRWIEKASKEDARGVVRYPGRNSEERLLSDSPWSDPQT